MTALYIILGILAFFFILFSIPVHVVASVNTEVKLWIRFLFVKIPIFPRKKKPKKQGKQTSEPKPKKEKTKKKKETAKTEGGPKKKKSVHDIVGLVKLLLKIVAAVLRKFPRHFGVTIHAYEISIATGDAAKTAIAYGAVTGLSANLFRALRKATRFRIKRKAPVNVYTDFVGTKPRANICIDLNLTINDVLSMAMAAGLAFVKHKMQTPKDAPAEDASEKAEGAPANAENAPETADAANTPAPETKAPTAEETSQNENT